MPSFSNNFAFFGPMPCKKVMGSFRFATLPPPAVFISIADCFSFRNPGKFLNGQLIIDNEGV